MRAVPCKYRDQRSAYVIHIYMYTYISFLFLHKLKDNAHIPQQTWALQVWKRCRSPASSSRSVWTKRFLHDAPKTWTHSRQANSDKTAPETWSKLSHRTSVLCLVLYLCSTYPPTLKQLITEFLVGLVSPVFQFVFILKNPELSVWTVVEHHSYQKKTPAILMHTASISSLICFFASKPTGVYSEMKDVDGVTARVFPRNSLYGWFWSFKRNQCVLKYKRIKIKQIRVATFYVTIGPVWWRFLP